MIDKTTDMNALISVIVPCYKVEKYLSRCVDSILAQTYNNLEIWLVDDGSPDRCGEICDEYANNDLRIKVIHKENGGLSDARNVAIDRAQGEWITFVDSDDYITDDYIETLYSLARKYNSQVSVANYQMVKDGDSVVLTNENIVEEKMDAKYAVEQMFYQERFDNTAWGKLYHRSLFESGIRYPKGLLFEDLPTTYRLFFECEHIAITSKKVYYYLLRPTSIEGAYSPRKVDSMLEVLKLMEKNMKQLCWVEDAYRCRTFSFVLHIFLTTPKEDAHYDYMVNYIKRNRCAVLFNRKARKKARFAALLSYCGLSCLKYTFVFVNKRS